MEAALNSSALKKFIKNIKVKKPGEEQQVEETKIMRTTTPDNIPYSDWKNGRWSHYLHNEKN